MMRTQQLLVLFVTLVLFSCKQSPKKEVSGFVLNGQIEGLNSGSVIVNDFKNGKCDTIQISEGKFTITGDYTEPTMINLTVKNVFFMLPVFAENEAFELRGSKKKAQEIVISGGQAHRDMQLFKQKRDSLKSAVAIATVYKEMRNPDLSDKRKKELEERIDAYKNSNKDLQVQFIKALPESHYSASLVERLCYGKTPEKVEMYLSLLSPKLQSSSVVQELRSKLSTMKSSHLGLKDFIKNVSNVSYKKANDFDGSKYKNVVYLSQMKNDNICALQKDGQVLFIDSKGKQLNQFKAKGSNCTVIATDETDQIYVLDVQQKIVKQKVRGRVIERSAPNGVICTIYTREGKELRNFNCSENITAAGVKYYDGKLIVSDCKQGKVAFYDTKTGKLLSKIDDLRPCCGMLDVALNKDKQLMVANLGAFRVQCLDLNGKKLMTFGNRGKAIDEFHSCCNPVSVAGLNNGAIVTVEKEPTRVKVYSKEGAKVIAGIEELVKGCAYIPMTVDSKDNLYLASREKGILKCVSVN